jgi:hypothetical protein
VGEREIVEARELAALAEADRAREPRAVAVDRDHERALEAAREVRVRGVGEVVLAATELVEEPEAAQPSSSSAWYLRWSARARRDQSRD